MRKDDLVEVAGNTQNRDERTVHVVSGGKVVANAHYSRSWTAG